MKNNISLYTSVKENLNNWFFKWVKKSLKRFKNSLLELIPDRLFITIQYFQEFWKIPNLRNPQTFNEKINVFKITQFGWIFSQLADKYKVREYIIEKIWDEILPKLLWEWKNPYDIPFWQLPSKFVIKCNHWCGFNIIIKDKEKININEIINQLNERLNQDLSRIWRELQYKYIERRIIVEELLEDPSQPDLVDYKFFCFNWEPNFIQVDIWRYNEHKRFMSDIHGNKLDFYIGRMWLYEWDFIMPESLDIMNKYAKKLSTWFPFVRVDFYFVNNKIYFWEITFTPCNWYWHFHPNHFELDKKIWSLIKI